MKRKNATPGILGIILVSFLLVPVSSDAQADMKLSDPEVASVAVTANQIDIDYAEIALKNSTNEEILNFARTMASDHKAVIDKAVALATKLGVTPQTNDLTRKLLSDAEKTKTLLKSKKGKTFDKTYISNEVAYHKSVISAVESVLIPETENKELKAFLESVLPALKAHLAHAEMVQKMVDQ